MDNDFTKIARATRKKWDSVKMKIAVNPNRTQRKSNPATSLAFSKERTETDNEEL